MWEPSGSCRKRLRQSGQDHLFSLANMEDFTAFKRSLCKIFCIQTGEKLRGGKGPAQRRALRSGSDRGEIKIRGMLQMAAASRFFYFTSLGSPSPRSKNLRVFPAWSWRWRPALPSVKNAWWGRDHHIGEGQEPCGDRMLQDLVGTVLIDVGPSSSYTSQADSGEFAGADSFDQIVGLNQRAAGH